MELPLDKRLSVGLQTIHGRTEPANGPWLPRIDEMCALVELVDRSGYDVTTSHFPSPSSTRCCSLRRPQS